MTRNEMSFPRRAGSNSDLSVFGFSPGVAIVSLEFPVAGEPEPLVFNFSKEDANGCECLADTAASAGVSRTGSNDIIATAPFSLAWDLFNKLTDFFDGVQPQQISDGLITGGERFWVDWDSRDAVVATGNQETCAHASPVVWKACSIRTKYYVAPIHLGICRTFECSSKLCRFSNGPTCGSGDGALVNEQPLALNAPVVTTTEASTAHFWLQNHALGFQAQVSVPSPGCTVPTSGLKKSPLLEAIIVVCDFSSICRAPSIGSTGATASSGCLCFDDARPSSEEHDSFRCATDTGSSSENDDFDSSHDSVDYSMPLGNRNYDRKEGGWLGDLHDSRQDRRRGHLQDIVLRSVARIFGLRHSPPVPVGPVPAHPLVMADMTQGTAEAQVCALASSDVQTNRAAAAHGSWGVPETWCTRGVVEDVARADRTGIRTGAAFPESMSRSSSCDRVLVITSVPRRRRCATGRVNWVSRRTTSTDSTAPSSSARGGHPANQQLEKRSSCMGYLRRWCRRHNVQLLQTRRSIQPYPITNPSGEAGGVNGSHGVQAGRVSGCARPETTFVRDLGRVRTVISTVTVPLLGADNESSTGRDDDDTCGSKLVSQIVDTLYCHPWPRQTELTRPPLLTRSDSSSNSFLSSEETSSRSGSGHQDPDASVATALSQERSRDTDKAVMAHDGIMSAQIATEKKPQKVPRKASIENSVGDLRGVEEFERLLNNMCALREEAKLRGEHNFVEFRDKAASVALRLVKHWLLDDDNEGSEMQVDSEVQVEADSQRKVGGPEQIGDELPLGVTAADRAKDQSSACMNSVGASSQSSHCAKDGLTQNSG